MKTYASLTSKNPGMTRQEIFDAGVTEGIRRMSETDNSKTHFSLEQIEAHDEELLDKVNQILRETMAGAGFADQPFYNLTVAIKRINDMRHGLAPKLRLRYSVEHMLPVCNLLPGSSGVPVTVWSSTVTSPVDAFYGMRLSTDRGQPACFYYAGGLIPDILYWRYRDEKEPQ